MFSLPKIAIAEETPEPERTSIRPYTPIKYGAVAGETVAGDLPKDHYIHAILLRVALGTCTGGTTGDWNADANEKIVKSVTVKAEGTKYFKQGQWKEFKQICIVNQEKQSDGSLKLYFTDPKIPEAKPLPSWKFTSLVVMLEFEAFSALHTGDRTGQTGTEVKITVVESHFKKGTDLTHWPLLVEAVRTKTVWGANTGWQTFEHERANMVSSFLYHADDNGTDNNVIFDEVTVIGRTPDANYPIYDQVPTTEIRESNKNAFLGQALDTGFWILEWPKGMNTRGFTSLKTQVNIKEAGANAGLRVMERYLL